jgi:hypothetical protein
MSEYYYCRGRDDLSINAKQLLKCLVKRKFKISVQDQFLENLLRFQKEN